MSESERAGGVTLGFVDPSLPRRSVSERHTPCFSVWASAVNLSTALAKESEPYHADPACVVFEDDNGRAWRRYAAVAVSVNMLPPDFTTALFGVEAQRRGKGVNTSQYSHGACYLSVSEALAMARRLIRAAAEAQADLDSIRPSESHPNAGGTP